MPGNIFVTGGAGENKLAHQLVRLDQQGYMKLEQLDM